MDTGAGVKFFLMNLKNRIARNFPGNPIFYYPVLVYHNTAAMRLRVVSDSISSTILSPLCGFGLKLTDIFEFYHNVAAMRLGISN
jgi:hypothetical protein